MLFFHSSHGICLLRLFDFKILIKLSNIKCKKIILRRKFIMSVEYLTKEIYVHFTFLDILQIVV